MMRASRRVLVICALALAVLITCGPRCVRLIQRSKRGPATAVADGYLYQLPDELLLAPGQVFELSPGGGEDAYYSWDYSLSPGWLASMSGDVNSLRIVGLLPGSGKLRVYTCCGEEPAQFKDVQVKVTW
jgi:hypothetical protein